MKENDRARRVAKKFIEINTVKLEEYTAKRKNFSAESDGLYMLLEGDANCINPSDENPCKPALKKYDIFGFGRFLSCNGLSYFGNVKAGKHKEVKTA